MYYLIFSRISTRLFAEFDNIFTTIQGFVTLLDVPADVGQEACYQRKA